MSMTTAALTVGGIVIPTIVLILFGAVLAIVVILMLLGCYYELRKLYIKSRHPDRLLLNEARKIREDHCKKREPPPQGQEAS